MELWNWKAVDSFNQVQKGRSIGQKSEDIRIKLQEQNLYPVLISKQLFSEIIFYKTSYKKNHLSGISRKFANLLSAGVPLLNVLDIVIKQEKNTIRKEQWKNVKLAVQSGGKISKAVNENIPSFGTVAQAVMQAGEESGALAESFDQMATRFEEEYFYAEKIKTALFYPVILLIVSLLVLLVMCSVILPMYESIFTGLEIKMPLISRIVFELGMVLPYFLLIFLVTTAVVFFKYKLAIFYRLPLIGEIIKYSNLIQFCGLMGRLLQAGISVNESLEQLRNVLTDQKLIVFIDSLLVGLLQGKKISEIILTDDYFPAEAAEMLAVGEESGRFGEALVKTAIIFNKEQGAKMERMIRGIEPLMILGLSFMIGFIAMGVLLPIFDLSSQIK